MSKAFRSEDELGLKLDRCIADTLLKVTGGLAIGVIASAALFKVGKLIHFSLFHFCFRGARLRSGLALELVSEWVTKIADTI